MTAFKMPEYDLTDPQGAALYFEYLFNFKMQFLLDADLAAQHLDLQIDDHVRAFQTLEKAFSDNKSSPLATLNYARCLYYGWGTEEDEDLSFGLFSELSDKGDIGAQFLLARCYEIGWGAEQDEKTAYDLYCAAAERGCIFSNYELGSWHETGIFLEPDLEEAREYYKRAIEQNYPPAIYKLGQLYEYENDTSADNLKAYECYLKAANQGYAEAQYELGSHYVHAFDPPNFLEAKQWFLLAAENNHGKACLSLGEMFEKGYGCDVDLSRAIHFYNQAIEEGEYQAFYALGMLYLEHPGLEPVEEAIELLEEASEYGHMEAQLTLGNVYFAGTLVEEDLQVAAQYFEYAASQGSMEAQYNMGLFCLSGTGVQIDCERAFDFFEMAADQGCKDSLVQKANCQINGMGVSQNVNKGILTLSALFHAHGKYLIYIDEESMEGEFMQQSQLLPSHIKNAGIILRRAYKKGPKIVEDQERNVNFPMLFIN